MQRILAIAKLTWKSAFRYRVFWAIAALLLISVLVLPVLLKHDGTARGFTQILLTYSLSVMTTLLGFATLWLACGTMAREIEENQIQMVAVKPIARWQIWLGKWVGILALNTMLVALSGGCIYALLMWRASSLRPDQQAILRNEIFTARGSLREPAQDIEGAADRLFKEELKKRDIPPTEQSFLRQYIREQLKSTQQIVPPNHLRRWQIELGLRRHLLRDQPMFFRFRFHAAQTNAGGLYTGVWRIGPSTAPIVDSGHRDFASDSFQEYQLPPNTWNENGQLTVEFENRSEVALLFPLEDGFEVLYRESTFGLNYVRGLAIILSWLSLLAAIGLAAASLVSFPVAAFCSASVLVIVMSSGSLASAVDEGAIFGVDHDGNPTSGAWIDAMILPFFRALLRVINLVQAFSPVDALSSGRSITWGYLGLAVLQVVIFLGGIFALAGIWFLSRRELAATQSNV